MNPDFPVARLLLALSLSCAVLPATVRAEPAAALPAAASEGDVDGDVRAALEARYAQWQQAVASRKAERIRPLLAPGFTRTDLGGNVMNADRMIGKLAAIPLDPDRTSSTTIEALRVDGDIAQVEHRQDASQVRAGADGTSHTMALTTLARDTWVRTGKEWLLKATQDEHTTITRDGVVVRTIDRGDAFSAQVERDAAQPGETSGPRGDAMAAPADVMTGR